MTSRGGGPDGPETAGERAPASADVVIVGGAIVGSSVAYHLLLQQPELRVVVLERDPTYRRASTWLAMGGVRQQFGSVVNVRLVQESLALYERFDEVMAVDGRPASARLRQRGYLFLVNAAGRERHERRLAIMQRAGAQVRRVATGEIAAMLPDADLDDVEFGVFGPRDGYADPRGILEGFRRKAASMGAHYLHDEVVEVERAGGRVHGVRLAGGARIPAAVVVNAAGPHAASVATRAGVEVPVVPVRQQLVRADLPRPWPYHFPMVVDPSGTHWRHDDPRNAIVIAKTRLDEPPGERFDAEPERFETDLLPDLRRRVPAFEGLRLADAWAGLYEMTADHNAILGEHPDLRGFVLATGFSGHGVMMAPATGKVTAEIITTGRATSVDVSMLGVSRFRDGALVHDAAMI